MRDTITRIEDDAGGTTRSIDLDGDVHGGRVEGVEYDLRHLLSVRLRIERCLGEQNGVLLGATRILF